MDTRRFNDKAVMAPGGCWQWVAFKNASGYGVFKIDGAARLAHRVAYGPIPEGVQLDHLCRNRACVNPSHLEAVTPRENWSRGEATSARQARQTHCLRGHPLEGDNLSNRIDGARVCVACRRARERVAR